MIKPEITIGIPFYNSGAFLELAILSVLGQTLKNWKLILLDDGSTDSISCQIATYYRKKDKRIVFFSDGKNRGLVSRLNQLASNLESKYYARMDADDIMHPTRLEKQLAYLESRPELDACGSNAITIDEENFIINRLTFVWPKNKLLLLRSNTVIHPSLLFKSSWVYDNRYIHKWRRIEDLELWFRTFDNLSLGIIKEDLLFYRLYSNSFNKYKITEKYKRKFLGHIIKDKNSISASYIITLIALSYLKQFLFPLLKHYHFNDNKINWKLKLEGLYELNKLQKKSIMSNG